MGVGNPHIGVKFSKALQNCHKYVANTLYTVSKSGVQNVLFLCLKPLLIVILAGERNVTLWDGQLGFSGQLPGSKSPARRRIYAERNWKSSFLVVGRKKPTSLSANHIPHGLEFAHFVVDMLILAATKSPSRSAEPSIIWKAASR